MKAQKHKRIKWPVGPVVVILAALIGVGLIIAEPEFQRGRVRISFSCPNICGDGCSGASGRCGANMQCVKNSRGFYGCDARQAVNQAVTQAGQSTQQAASGSRSDQTGNADNGQQAGNQTRSGANNFMRQLSTASNRAVAEIQTRITAAVPEEVKRAAELLRNEMNAFISQTGFESWIVQSSASPRFRMLVIGNGMSKAELDSNCRGAVDGLRAIAPYLTNMDKLEVTCGKFGLNIIGAGGSFSTPTKNVKDNPAAILAQAKLFLLANAKRLQGGYHHAVILENSYGRSYAFPQFNSAIVFTKDRRGRMLPTPSVGNTFRHEYSHLFCLADEYEAPAEMRQLNDVSAKLGFPETRSQLDGLQQICLSVPNCVYKTGNSCPQNWFEGCALVSTGTCRPSNQSLMRNGAPFLNEPSIKQIQDAFNGAAIYKVPLP